MKFHVRCKNQISTFVVLFGLFVASCGNPSDDSVDLVKKEDDQDELIPSTFSEPLFPNSIVATDIDYIHSNDPDDFDKVVFIGRENKETPGSDVYPLEDIDTYVFEMHFDGGNTVPVWCHSSFSNMETAQSYVEKLGPRFGKLPAVHRQNITHVVILNEDRTAFAEIDGHFFVLASENMDVRISNNDLEETVFHEAVHASIQRFQQSSDDWKRVSNADKSRITKHAEREIEDMAETAIFAYTLENNPERLPENVKEFLIDHIPNKIAFFDQFYK